MININITKKLHGNIGKMDLDINLTIKECEFIALTGESGSGKTTFLRTIAGFEDADGKIDVSGNVWLNSKLKLPPQKRDIGFVFQDYALFPNMNIIENLLFVKKDKELANYLLDITELSELKYRYPNTLSGGQKQRVSLCRAFMNKPKILLMDEPLSALDPYMRNKLQNEILILHKEFKTTTIMVSHDPSEIYKLSSRVIILDKGKVINDGYAKDILLKHNNSTEFLLEGELLDIIKVDIVYIAIISIGQQLVKVVVSKSEILDFKIGDRVSLTTKSFTSIIC